MQREVISGGSIPGGSESINDWRAFEQGVHWGRRLSHFNFLLERIDEAKGEERQRIEKGGRVSF